MSMELSSSKALSRRFVTVPVVRKLYKRADVIVNQCQGMLDDLIEYLGVDAQKCIVINNPVSPIVHQYKFSLNEKIITDDDFILCVGRLEPQKGFQYAIESFSLLIKRFPTLRLKILGSGKLKLELQEIAHRLNVIDSVDFEGEVLNVGEFYQNAKATILTSLYEGFPNVLIESISFGTPVVAFDCKSGPKEIIISGENGYLVQNQDIHQLANCIGAILLKPISKEKILATAVRYNTDVVVGQYEAVLCQQ